MKESVSPCNLKDCLLCRLCLPDWIPAVGLHRKNFLVKKGQRVFQEGNPVSGIYFVYSGIMKIHKKWDQEKELIIRFARQGDMIGHLGLGKEARYPASATALETSIVCYLSIPFFESTLRVNTQLTYTLMRFLADELQESHRGMRDLAHMSVKARVAHALISLKEQFGVNEEGTINITLSRQDLASFAGTTYETLFKTLNEFTREGAVKLDGKNMTLTDEDKLRLIVQEDNR